MEVPLPILTEFWQQMAAAAQKQIQGSGKYLAFVGFLPILLSIAKSPFLRVWWGRGVFLLFLCFHLIFSFQLVFFKLFFSTGMAAIKYVVFTRVFWRPEMWSLLFPVSFTAYFKVIKSNSTSKWEGIWVMQVQHTTSWKPQKSIWGDWSPNFYTYLGLLI